MSHYGATPNAIVEAVLTGLSVFKLQAGSGCVRTIKRLANDKYDLEAIDGVLTAGLPAWLVSYLGGVFEAAGCGQRYLLRMAFGVVCAAGRHSAIGDRLAGDASDPGVEDLLDWATYYAMRAVNGVNGVQRARPLRHRWLRFEPTKYVAAFEFDATRMVDIYDDAPETILESLGIVHDPLDPEELWEADNLTPKSEMPPTTDGGVTTL